MHTPPSFNAPELDILPERGVESHDVEDAPVPVDMLRTASIMRVRQRTVRGLRQWRERLRLPTNSLARVRWLLVALNLVWAALLIGLVGLGNGLPLHRIFATAGLAITTVVCHLLATTVSKHERAIARERILRKAGTVLVAAVDRPAIYRAALEAAQALVDRDNAATRISIAVGTVEQAVIVAVTGRAPGKEQSSLQLRHLSPALLERLLAGQPVAWQQGAAAPITGGQQIVTVEPWRGAMLVLPLMIQGELRGVLVIAGEGQLKQDVQNGLEALVSQLALALESATLSENLHRRQHEARFRSLVQNASDIIAIVDRAGTITYMSSSIKRVMGYRPEVLVGSHYLDYVHSEDQERMANFFAECLSSPNTTRMIEIRHRHADGIWRYVETIGNNLLDDRSVGGVVINARDTTERKALEEQLIHQAFHDPLTNLPNRALFMNRLEHALARAARHHQQIAVLFLDLDRFKVINDSLGHQTGDQLLVAVARRLQASLRPADTVARLGGDEFTVLLEDIADEQAAVEIAERIAEHLALPFTPDGNEVFADASIGIALSTPATDGPNDLVRCADVAMYEAKTKGKGRYAVFAPSLDVDAWERLEVETNLRRALDRGEFEVFYQPIVRLDTEQIIGVEALVRWKHPRRGIVPPSEFIPVAEETGLILQLGHMVLREACRQLHYWQQQQPDGAPQFVSVNLSARQFQHSNLVADIANVLAETGLDPHALELEITESIVMENGESTLGVLRQLKALGIQLAIDDFGTGYSSLAYLKRFPIDTLKIDRSFVDKLGQEPEDTAIVQAITTLAQTLNQVVTGEGVETLEQLLHLRNLGCDRGQGYYFAKPLSASGMAALFHTAQPREHYTPIITAERLELA